MNESASNPVVRESFPVSVVMSHKQVSNNIWATSQWNVEAVVAGGGTGTDEPEKMISRMGDDNEQYIWSNYQVNLFADEAESYYFNIISDTPYVFVICRDENGDNEPVPFIVSVNYDEAASFMELDDQVFQVPMPPELYRWVESFVVNHYVPVKKKKRKLANWKEQSSKDNNRVKH